MYTYMMGVFKGDPIISSLCPPLLQLRVSLSRRLFARGLGRGDDLLKAALRLLVALPNPHMIQ